MADPPTCLALVSPIPGSPLEYTPYKTAKLSTQKAPDAHGVEARASKAGSCRPPTGQKSTGAFSTAERSVDTHGGFRGGFRAVLKGVPWGFRGVPWGFRGGSAKYAGLRHLYFPGFSQKRVSCRSAKKRRSRPFLKLKKGKWLGSLLHETATRGTSRSFTACTLASSEARLPHHRSFLEF